VKTVNDLVKELLLLAAFVSAAAAWVAYAEHPTARNLRVAIIDTLRL
jgi:hypothetical protein